MYSSACAVFALLLLTLTAYNCSFLQSWVAGFGLQRIADHGKSSSCSKSAVNLMICEHLD